MHRKNIPDKKYQFNTGKQWTDEDEKYLLEFINVSNLELAYSLGRSIGAIAQKKSELRRYIENEKV